MRSRVACRSLLLATVATLLLFPLRSSAATPPLGASLVADLNTVASPQSSYLNFGNGGTQSPILGNTAFFFAYNAEAHPQLWASNGTEAGTRLVRDFFNPPFSSFDGLSRLGSKLYFFESQHDSLTLWQSDGTTAGTYSIRRIEQQTGRTVPVTVVGNTLFFLGQISPGAFILWASDGTAAGTRAVRELSLEAPIEFVGVQNVLLFVTRGSTTLLWRSDGTPNGTQPIATFKCGSIGDYELVATASRAFFAADDCATGSELWSSDGTAAGTGLVADIDPGTNASYPHMLAALGNTLLFSAYDATHKWALWASDGTAQSTRFVADIRTEFRNPSGPDVTPLTVMGNRLFFAADDGTHGSELWVSDGTTEGTHLVADILPGSLGSGPRNGATANGLVYFYADDGTHGREPWVSDGSPEGTRLVADIRAGAASSEPVTKPLGAASLISAIGSALLMSADDGVHGTELWGSDGTAQGTHLLANIASDTGSGGFYPRTELGGHLVFIARDAGGTHRLWRSDGTAEGTAIVQPAQPGVLFQPGIMARRGGELLLSNNADKGLWRSDGTSQGTALVKQFALEPTNLANASGTVYLTASTTGNYGVPNELWRSDGTSAGTFLIRSFPVVGTPNGQTLGAPPQIGPIDPPTFPPAHLTPLGSSILFSAYDPATGSELWRSDGTPAGTVLVKDLAPGSTSSFPTDLTVVGGRIFFLANSGDKLALWVTDGTAAGTQQLHLFLSLPGEESWLTAVGNKLFLSADDGTSGRELWVSDGTQDGTRLAADIAAGATSAAPSELTAVGGQVFFSADDRVSGRELWASDGTQVGTHLVADISPLASDSSPNELFNWAGKLLFAADDGVHGRELWQSDGTAQGTVLAASIAPGVASSSPAQMVVVGGVLYFSADDGTHGRELWRYDGTPAGTSLVAPSFIGVAPGATVTVPVRIARGAPFVGAGTATLTATLPSGVRYVADTSGVTPTQDAGVLTWVMPAPTAGEQRAFALELAVPNAPLGTRFPLTLALTAPGPDGAAVTTSQRVEVMVARQVWLPFVAK